MHGDIHSLIACLKDLQKKKTISEINPLKIIDPDFFLIFHGDYVDRGMWGVEVLYLLMLLKIHNPYNVFLIRGNHEDIQITSHYGFNREFMEKFSDVSEMDRMRCFNKIAVFYNYLPLVLYVGSGTDKKSYVQCNHGGIEFGYNPKEFLHTPESVQFHWIEKFNRATECSHLSDHSVQMSQAGLKPLKQLCEDFVAHSPMHPYVNGFLWHDFTVDPCETISYSSGRGFKFNQALTLEALKIASSNAVKLCGVIRAHQHIPNNNDPMMKLLLESHGCASLWQEKRELRFHLHEGFVLTLLLSPDSLHGTPNVGGSEFSGFDYDTSAFITTGNDISKWTVQIINNHVYEKRNQAIRFSTLF